MAKQRSFGKNHPSKRELDLTALESFGVICGPCSREDKYSHASNFCFDCGENLCKSCVQAHRNMKKTSNHMILSKTKGESKVQHLPDTYERCPRHLHRVLEMYCPIHDIVVCADCINSDHRGCQGVRHIPEIAKGVQKTTEYSKAMGYNRELTEQFQALKREWSYNLRSLKKQREAMINTIADVRRQISFLLDKLEKNTRDALQALYQTECRNVEAEMRGCDSVLVSLEKVEDKLRHAARTKNETQIFVDVNIARKSLDTFDAQYKEMVIRQKEPRIEFSSYEPVKAFPKLEALGKLTMSYGGEGGTDYNIRLSSDRKACDVTGIACLADGRIVLTDRGNNRLKLLDTHYHCTHHCDLPGQPFDVCSIGPNELAISFASLTRIQFVEVDKQIRPTRSFETLETVCWGLSYNGSELYAVSWKEKPSVRAYDLNGKLRRVFELRKDGENLFSDPRRLVVNKDGTRIFVTDTKKGVMTLDNAGQVVSVFQHQKLLSPIGVVFAPEGGLYVCGKESHNLVHIGDDGKTMTTLLSAGDGIRNPKYLCFDGSRRRLIMACDNSDTIRVWLSF